MDLTICPLIDNNLDLLARQPFVDNILRVAEALSDNKKNACYAINGSWGVGKTFVLDMFENQAKDIGREGKTLPRYLVFRYNCWEYDYYGEPLIAIVASMLDQIDANEHLIPQEIRSKIVAILKVIGKGLVKKTVQIASDATSVDIANIIDKISEMSNDSEEKQKEVNAYDQYFEFKKILLKLQETIKELSENQTLIFIVDELDRCLPEYTIKVLERLHHLFNGIPNVQVVIAIDKGQLEHVVKQIYGEQTDVNKYLAKFISFELKLGDSVFSDQEKFAERFKQYTSRFDTSFKTTTVLSEFFFLIIQFLSTIIH